MENMVWNVLLPKNSDIDTLSFETGLSNGSVICDLVFSEPFDSLEKCVEVIKEYGQFYYVAGYDPKEKQDKVITSARIVAVYPNQDRSKDRELGQIWIRLE